MIELLVVIIIIAILVGLLLPAINAAIRAAKNAAVSAEISQLAQAIESFKKRYGDYPPSRLILYENGLFPVTSNLPIPGENISYGVLGQQSLSAMRQFFPKVPFNSSVVPAQVQQGNGSYWYDFNGNGVFDQTPYILHGHECLVFFLGGIPLPSQLPNGQGPVPVSSSFGMSGFGSDPNNPFTNNIAVDPRYPNNTNPMYSPNRQPAIFEFNPGRLFMDPNNNALDQLTPAQMPGYYDTLGTGPPGTAAGTTTNYYAYFSAYGNGAYNPDDVNFVAESDANLAAPIGLKFVLAAGQTTSPAPNPYTSTLTVPSVDAANNTISGNVSFQKAQSYQIISAGADGLYGVGGQYVATTSNSAAGSVPLPFDANDTYAGTGNALTTDSTIRQREGDNLTNFKSGTLQ